MHITINQTELYFDVEGPELTVVGAALQHRPTMVVLHGGPGFDQGYLRPGLRALAALCAALGIERPVLFGHSAGGFVALRLALRHPGLVGGLILCHSAPALGLAEPDGPPGPAQRGGPAAGAAAARLFAGDFSAAALEAFDRLVLPLYAAPGHEGLPGRLMALSTINAELAAYFFRRLAPGYDVRPELPGITADTLVIAGRHDWVCTPAAGRALAASIPNSRLVELDAGHFGFSETPAPALSAVREHLERVRPPRNASLSEFAFVQDGGAIGEQTRGMHSPTSASEPRVAGKGQR